MKNLNYVICTMITKQMLFVEIPMRMDFSHFSLNSSKREHVCNYDIWSVWGAWDLFMYLVVITACDSQHGRLIVWHKVCSNMSMRLVSSYIKFISSMSCLEAKESKYSYMTWIPSCILPNSAKFSLFMFIKNLSKS